MGALFGGGLAVLSACTPTEPSGGGGLVVPPPTPAPVNRNRNVNSANQNLNKNASQNQNGDSTGPVGPPGPGGNANGGNQNQNTSANNNENAGGNANSNGSTNSNSGNGNSANCNLNCANAPANLVPPDLGVLPNETVEVGFDYRSDPIPILRGTQPFVYSLLRAPSGARFVGSRLRWDVPIQGFAPCVIELLACNCAGSDTLQVTIDVLPESGSAITRASIGHNCSAPNHESSEGGISDDGNLIVFQTDATNVVPGDTNETSDIFLVNRSNGEIRRLSVNEQGEQTLVSEPSIRPRISGDGSTVVFQSFSTVLVPDDTNGATDVFVVDLAAGKIDTPARNAAGVIGDAGSDEPALSPDGNFIVFRSASTNLVPNDTNGIADIFIRDRMNNTIERVSVATGGIEANGISSQPAVSPDGRFVVFASDATNLVPDDTNNVTDVFLHDRQTGITTRVSVGTGGIEANGPSVIPSIGGPDNSLIVFASTADNLVGNDGNGDVDVFVHNRLTGETSLVSVNLAGTASGNGLSQTPAITPDGRYVVFQSLASDLVLIDLNNSADIFRRDLVTGTTVLVSRTAAGDQGDGPSSRPQISADGRFIIFDTKATTLTLSDLDPSSDVLIVDMTLMP
jgi:Tol biopolymer transport system component